ncbi:MAG: YbjQ family protein [Desulfuromonadaceae bacterium]|nr:YbjQ family protein [Desulfuromonadaceae bacterium]
MESLAENFNMVLFLVLLAVGYFCGSLAERRHYASITQRETEQLNFQTMTIEPRLCQEGVQECFLVQGSAVISIDYFKRLLAVLRNIFGGRVKAYESLVDRARREAILRLKEQALAQGADMVVNLRLETSAIGNSANRKKQVGSVEAIAYGTAVTLNKP